MQVLGEQVVNLPYFTGGGNEPWGNKLSNSIELKIIWEVGQGA
jgi:hypothetical protein